LSWKEASLGQLCDDGGGEVKTGPFGSQLHQSDYADHGTPVVMPKDIIRGRVSEIGIARVGAEHVERLSHHRLSIGDIVYGRRGDIGRCALVTETEAGWLCGTGCLRVTLGEAEVDPQFLFYFLNHPDTVTWIFNQAVGATMPNLNTGILRSVPVRYPPLPTQQRIAAILSAYDDLIENNTLRIAILEEMARRLYEEGFVHFRFPGHETAEFDCEMPRGWSAVELQDLVQVNPRTSVPREGLKPFVPMGSLSQTSMVIEGVEKREGNSGTKFQNADTLVARITPCLENGKTGFVNFLSDDQPVAFGSTEFIVLRPLVLGPCAIYCLSRSHAFRDVAIRSMSGAEGRQRVRPESVQTFPMAQPPQELLDRFEAIAAPMFSQISALARQNTNLRAQRDLLLPKLVSGEIDVSEAKTVLEAAE